MTDKNRFTIYASAVQQIKDLILLGEKELTNAKIKKMHIYNLTCCLTPIRKEKVVVTSYLTIDSHISVETLKNGTYYYNGEQINSHNMKDYFYSCWSYYSPRNNMKVQLVVDRYFFDIKKVLECIINQVKIDTEYQEELAKKHTEQYIQEIKMRRYNLKILKNCLL